MHAALLSGVPRPNADPVCLGYASH